MRTHAELKTLLASPSRGLTIQADELRLLIQHHEWLLVWNAFVYTKLSTGDFDFLRQLQKYIQFPEYDPFRLLRAPQAAEMTDNRPGKEIWRNNIFPKLTLRDQVHLSQVNKYFFKLSTSLHELKDEFPAYAKALLLKPEAIDLKHQLVALRAVAYSKPEKPLQALFEGVSKRYSASEFSKMTPYTSLPQWIKEEREADPTLPIEKFSVLVMSIKSDQLSTLLFFLSCTLPNDSLNNHQILKYCSQYGAITIFKFFIWAFSNNNIKRYDPYLHIACINHQTEVIKLLAPRVYPITLTMCFIAFKKKSLSENIIKLLSEYGAVAPEDLNITRDYCYNSSLMKDIIRTDTAENLSIFLQLWTKNSTTSILHSICSEKNDGNSFPLNIIAYLLFRLKNIPPDQKCPSLTLLAKKIANSPQLHTLLTQSFGKGRVILLPPFKFKLITQVCHAAHVENFRLLLNNGLDINACFASKKHVLTSPLSRASFRYSQSQRFFSCLVENGAVFTPLAACHAVEGNQLEGLKSLMKLPDAVIPTDTLEYHPLFVAAQFGRLECFDFLMSEGITLDSFAPEQLFELLLQGPIAGLAQLAPIYDGYTTNWLGPLYTMRSILLKKMHRVEIGNKYGFSEANPREFPRFLKEKSEVYLRIICMILPYVKNYLQSNETVLHIALTTGNVTLVLLVLACSPAIDTLDQKNRNCLLKAAQLENQEMVIALLEYSDHNEVNLINFPVSLSRRNPKITALLINSKQYSKLNFPEFPAKDLCEDCLTYLTHKFNNPINPALAEVMYERYRLHPNMISLERIRHHIEDITSHQAWNEQGLSRITIENISYWAPGIIAEIYNQILNFYKLPYTDAIKNLADTYQCIRNLAGKIEGFRLRLHSSTTIDICRTIKNFLSDEDPQTHDLNPLNAKR